MMILPTGILPSSDTSEYLKNLAIQSWKNFFHKALEVNDKSFEKLTNKRLLPFVNYKQMLEDLMEFCLSDGWVSDTVGQDLYHYPRTAARFCHFVSEKGGLSPEEELDWIARIGKVLWVRIFEASRDDEMLISSLKEYVHFLKMDSLMSTIFLSNLFSENYLLLFYDIASHRDFPIEWMPALFALIPREATLDSLENALVTIQQKRPDLVMADFLANPDSAFYLKNMQSLATLQKDTHPLLNEHLPSLVDGMMNLLKNPYFRKEDLKVYNHLVVLLFFAMPDVKQSCTLLTDYVENLGIENFDWIRFVGTVFSMIADSSQRRQQFLLMARSEDFPEQWREAYYLIVDLDQPFEGVVSEWQEAKDSLDLSLFAPELPAFFDSALEKSLPKSIEIWKKGATTDAAWIAAWAAEQERITSIWNILCDADWDLWAPLAKEYYFGIVLGLLGRGMELEKIPQYKGVRFSREGHLRLSTITYKAEPNIVKDSEADIELWMKPLMVFLSQDTANIFFWQQLGLYMATLLLMNKKQVGLRLLVRERLVMDLKGQYPEWLQLSFQKFALSGKVMARTILELYQLMGNVAFEDKITSDLAIQFIKSSSSMNGLPIGSLKFVLESIFGEDTVFNQQSIADAGAELLKASVTRTSDFMPASEKDVILLLRGLADQSMHRHFKGLLPLLVSLFQKFQLNDQLEGVLKGFASNIRRELRSVLRTLKIPADLRQILCQNGESFIEQVVKLYMKALLS